MAPKTLVVDNEDSFTYNLVALVASRGGRPFVVRHDLIDLPALVAQDPTHILISPGPGRPHPEQPCLEVLLRFQDHRPVLGVCLGMQSIGFLHGAETVRAPIPVHGKTDLVRHDNQGIFRNVPNPLLATRYHSLIVDPEGLSSALEPTAWTEDGLLMGIRHRERPLLGVQFHPESFMTQAGATMIDNFLEMA